MKIFFCLLFSSILCANEGYMSSPTDMKSLMFEIEKIFSEDISNIENVKSFYSNQKNLVMSLHTKLPQK